MVSKREIKAMVKHKDVQGLLRLVDHPDEDVQENALQALSTMADLSCFDKVMEIIRSDNSSVRLEAIFVLRYIAAKYPQVKKKTFNLFLRILRNHNEELRVRGGAASGLAVLAKPGDRSVLEPMVELLYDMPYDHKNAMLTLLTETGDRSVLEHFPQFFGSGNIKLKVEALKGIVKFCQYGDDFLVDDLIEQGLNSPLPMFKPYAVEALGKIGNKKALPHLKKICGIRGALLGNTVYYPILKKAAEEAIRKIESGNYPEKRQHQPPNGQATHALCPGCGSQLSFVKEYARWYCYDCEDYAPEDYRPRTPTPKPRTRRAAPACPSCGGHLKFIKEYRRWYCYSCEEYAASPEGRG